ncbi:MAG: hypothetical protein JXA21_14975 [Anaerolineae bacterium]|nr:hypothetical protein [Anaerolineae bacterium]
MQPTSPDAKNSTRQPLYRIAGVAALLAALFFRRNIGAEVSLFTGVEGIPHSAAQWFVLLQTNPFVGLSFLAFFDLVNSALVGLVFLALGALLWRTHKSSVTVALASGLVGIAVSFTANISLTLLSLSQRYAVTATEAQKADLLAAGQAILATNDPLAAFPGTGAVVSLLLIALAGLLFAVLLLPSHRATAVVGLMAGGCDLVYCLTFPLTPVLPVYLLLAAAGLFWMVWHLLVGRMLLQRAKE